MTSTANSFIIVAAVISLFLVSCESNDIEETSSSTGTTLETSTYKSLSLQDTASSKKDIIANDYEVDDEAYSEIVLNLDNFYDFFEYDERAVLKTNAEGQIEEGTIYQIYVLKDEYVQNIDFKKTDLCITVSCQNSFRACYDVDVNSGRISIVETTETYTDLNKNKTLRLINSGISDMQRLDSRYVDMPIYYFELGAAGATVHDMSNENTIIENSVAWLYQEYILTDVTGSIFFY